MSLEGWRGPRVPAADAQSESGQSVRAAVGRAPCERALPGLRSPQPLGPPRPEAPDTGSVKSLSLGSPLPTRNDPSVWLTRAKTACVLPKTNARASWN